MCFASSTIVVLLRMHVVRTPQLLSARAAVVPPVIGKWRNSVYVFVLLTMAAVPPFFVVRRVLHVFQYV